MTMPLFNGRFVSRAFFVPLKNPDGNILAFVYKDEREPRWVIHIRFRYYARSRGASDNTYSYEAAGEDGGAPGPTITAAKLALDNALLLADGGPIEELIVESSTAKLVFEMIRAQRWRLTQAEASYPSA